MYLLKYVSQLRLLLLLVLILFIMQFILECQQYLVVVLDLVVLVLGKLLDLASTQRLQVRLPALCVKDVLFVLNAQLYRLYFVFNLLLALLPLFLFLHLGV